jgi:hypothetical protein
MDISIVVLEFIIIPDDPVLSRLGCWLEFSLYSIYNDYKANILASCMRAMIMVLVASIARHSSGTTNQITCE